jgi:glycerate 2-kinase
MQDHTQHAIDIWQAGVDAVSSEQLVSNIVQCDDDCLTICGEAFNLRDFNRIAVVGAGKAGSGMSASLLNILGPAASRVSGWVNVPEDCVRELDAVTLHAARPAGVNEPTEAGVFGSNKILELVGELDSSDLCIVLLSGGGSALLPAPIDGVSLADKQQVTRQLMHAGASIGELNCVRKKLSNLKGGGLARACRAPVRGLIISDVIGDPLDVIASGPTTEDRSTIDEALEILGRLIGLDRVPAAIIQSMMTRKTEARQAPLEHVVNHVIGNNEVAVLAASQKAMQLGYRVIQQGIGLAGVASDEGVSLAQSCLAERRSPTGSMPVCFINGGEPTVRLAETDLPRKGGRNQELVLGALRVLQNEKTDGLTILSGGTDGEDGPTDAAGAWVDSVIIQSAQDQSLIADDFLAINDSYHFFEHAGGLLKTGPTHTNVMDVRVAIVSK